MIQLQNNGDILLQNAAHSTIHNPMKRRTPRRVISYKFHNTICTTNNLFNIAIFQVNEFKLPCRSEAADGEVGTVEGDPVVLDLVKVNDFLVNLKC